MRLLYLLAQYLLDLFYRIQIHGSGDKILLKCKVGAKVLADADRYLYTCISMIL